MENKVELELNDGSELRPELEAEAEKLEKEVEKDLADKAEIVDELNEFEADVIDMGSSELHEELKLNEYLDPDYEFPFEAVEKVLDDKLSYDSGNVSDKGIIYIKNEDDFDDDVDLLDRYGFSYHYTSRDGRLEGVDGDFVDVDSITTEMNNGGYFAAIFDIECTISEEDAGELLGAYNESLNEAVPADLAKAYKYIGTRPAGWGIDLANAHYEEVSANDAKKILKTDPESIRALVRDGSNHLRVIRFDYRGYPDGDKDSPFRFKYVPYDIGYKKKNGDVITDTKYMPASYILQIADKIYVTDENTVKIDPELQRLRRQNPESKYYNTYVSDTYDIAGGYGSRPSLRNVQNAIPQKSYSWAKSVEEKRRELRSRFNSGSIDERQYIAELKDALYSWNRSKKSNARTRYYASEMTLQDIFSQFDSLKSETYNAKKNLESAEKAYNTAVASGGKTRRDAENWINYYKHEIANMQRELSKYLLKLENIDELDAAELAGVKATLDKYTANLADVMNKVASFKKDQIANLKNVSKFKEKPTSESLTEAKVIVELLDGYKPWSGAKAIWDRIKDAGKLGELDEVIDELYPDGVDETTLNDLLWLDSDYILELIGMGEDSEDEE